MGISAIGISKRFHDFVALDDVSIDVPEGSLTALLGPSGSGKSTLLRVIAGLEQPDAGEVTIDGKVATNLPPQHRGVGFVFQHYAAFRHMTVRDNVGFGLRIRREAKAEITRKVDELLKLVQIDWLADRYPHQLSGGQRQRMALARALAVEPSVLLLDEPFGALDARVREELRDWLRRLHERVPVTTVLVTHDQEEAMELASQVVVMDHGKIEQSGTPTELYRQPANAFVMSFVGKANVLEDGYIRPHDVVLLPLDAGAGEIVTIEHLVDLGHEVRANVTRANGDPLRVQLSPYSAEALGLAAGQKLRADLSRKLALSESAR